MRNTLALLVGFALAVPAVAADSDADKALVDALVSTRAVQKNEYKFVRTAVAKHFEATHADDIKAAFEDDHKTLTDWLAANPDVRDTLYTAIDPAVDDVKEALSLFRTLYKLGPDKLKAHPQLAVALAVVWDQREAIYDYSRHQVRTKSLLPETVASVDAIENYKTLLAQEKELKGPVLQLPWEFLVHVVNHRTPAGERSWAVKNFVKQRAGIGHIYKAVEYDTGMLETNSEVCKLNGQPYTLESILKHGGVCAMQADFAARVSKSLGVPGEYVGGEANNGTLHAWVMWAEVKAVKGDGSVDFTWQTHGQYFVDQYYVGHLIDPKSGQKTTDRDVARRLATVGAAPQNARQADLLMRFYPTVRDAKGWTVDRQKRYLDDVLLVFPHAERGWLELAALHADAKLKDSEIAVKLTYKAFESFAKHPDFSWKLLPGLMKPIAEKSQRMKLYDKAVLAYEALGRPDLACEARLELAGLQEEAKDYKKAADGLAQTIRKFPEEGRYVPKMMDALAGVCGKYDGGTDLLGKFYLELLPKIPTDRGTAYCLKLHQQAADFFSSHDKPKEAEKVKSAMAKIKPEK